MTLVLDRLDEVASSAFDGYLVRKDLVRRYAKEYPVPSYVVEFPVLSGSGRGRISQSANVIDKAAPSHACKIIIASGALE